MGNGKTVSRAFQPAAAPEPAAAGRDAEIWREPGAGMANAPFPRATKGWEEE